LDLAEPRLRSTALCNLGLALPLFSDRSGDTEGAAAANQVAGILVGRNSSWEQGVFAAHGGAAVIGGSAR
jgi:hypothetical protein